MDLETTLFNLQGLAFTACVLATAYWHFLGALI